MCSSDLRAPDDPMPVYAEVPVFKEPEKVYVFTEDYDNAPLYVGNLITDEKLKQSILQMAYDELMERLRDEAIENYRDSHTTRYMSDYDD